MATQQVVDVHASRGNLILALVIAFTSVGALITMLRLYTRFILLRTPAIDDAFITLAVVSRLVILSLIHTDMSKGTYNWNVHKPRFRYD
jgi:hypothetical protein